MKLYTIHDKEARTYGLPFYQQSDVVALRTFRTEINRDHQGNMLYAYPEHFALYKIGEYNTETGELTTHTLELVAEATTLRNDKGNGK